jgi:hypothetical protein
MLSKKVDCVSVYGPIVEDRIPIVEPAGTMRSDDRPNSEFEMKIVHGYTRGKIKNKWEVNFVRLK